MSLLDHATETRNHIDFVGTSSSLDVATSLFSKPGGYVYEIEMEGGIDVNASLGRMSPSAHESEIAFRGGIPWGNVVRAWKVNEFWEIDEEEGLIYERE